MRRPHDDHIGHTRGFERSAGGVSYLHMATARDLALPPPCRLRVRLSRVVLVAYGCGCRVHIPHDPPTVLVSTHTHAKNEPLRIPCLALLGSSLSTLDTASARDIPAICHGTAVPAYGMVFLPQNPSTGNGRIPD